MSLSLTSIAKLITRSVSLCHFVPSLKVYPFVNFVPFGNSQCTERAGSHFSCHRLRYGLPFYYNETSLFFFFSIKHAISLIPPNISRRPLSFSFVLQEFFSPQWRRIILFLISFHAKLHLSGATKHTLCIFSVAEYAGGDWILGLMGPWILLAPDQVYIFWWL